MIAIQKIGKSFKVALGYNLKKINHAELNRRALLLDSNFSSIGRQVVKGEVDLVRQLRPNLKRRLIEQVKSLYNKITKARELLLQDDINTANYKSIKSDAENKINLLVAKLADIGQDIINAKDLERLINKAISTLTNINIIFCKSDSSLHRKIIGSIYPEKFTFEEIKLRTAKTSETFNLIYLITAN